MGIMLVGGVPNKLDIILILALPVLASIASFVTEANAFLSVMFFFGLPALYISFRNTSYIRRAAIFSTCTSIPGIVVIDYIAHVTGQWLIPESVLPFRLFGYVTLEVVVWAFLNFYTVIVFYEFFLNHHHSKRAWNHRGKQLLLFIFATSLLFLTFFFVHPSSLALPYFYLLFGVLLILLPVIKQLSGHPNLISRFFVTTAYFFYLTAIYEITALKLGWWRFPSTEYIGTVNLLGTSFPFEEFLFWFLLFAMAILTFYEHFTGNERRA